MDGQLQIEGVDEQTLVEMFQRIDPRYAPKNCALLKQALVERGYVVADGEFGPGSVTPGPEKLVALLGASQPFESVVKIMWGALSGHRRMGSIGRIRIDGLTLDIFAEPRALEFRTHEIIDFRNILNVESHRDYVRIETPEGALHGVVLELPDAARASQLQAVLPKTRTPDFTPQLRDVIESGKLDLMTVVRMTPGVVGLVIANLMTYLVTAIAGGTLSALLRPDDSWGANISGRTWPLEPWRVVTAQFLHADPAHFAGNMCVLIAVGPLVERLIGIYAFLGLYLLSGACANILSLSVHNHIFSVGASGAVFGLIGSLGGLELRSHEPTVRTAILAQWPLSAYICFTGIALGLLDARVDVAAHVGGLAAGFLLGTVFVFRRASAQPAGAARG